MNTSQKTCKRAPVKIKRVIHVGDTYGDWTVTNRDAPSNGHTRWICSCPKGHTSSIFDRNLKTGASKWCPTCQSSKGAESREDEHILMRRRGNLLPIRWAPAGEYGIKRGHYLCLRGARFVPITRAHLLSGRRPNAGTKIRSRTPRTEAYQRTYRCWYDMRRRCDDSKHPDYPNYGGRGITYDPCWSSFPLFLYQMGESPDGRTLDRVDYNGHYIGRNCRWATPKEQTANRRPRNSAAAPVLPLTFPTPEEQEADRIREYWESSEHLGITI